MVYYACRSQLPGAANLRAARQLWVTIVAARREMTIKHLSPVGVPKIPNLDGAANGTPSGSAANHFVEIHSSIHKLTTQPHSGARWGRQAGRRGDPRQRTWRRARARLALRLSDGHQGCSPWPA